MTRAQRQITDDEAGERLDVVVARIAGVPRAKAGALIDDAAVSVNGRSVRKAHRVAAGDVIEIGEAAEAAVVDAPAGVVVTHEDDHLAVVDKPSGVVVHGGAGVRTGTMVDALRAIGMKLAPAAGAERPGIVHRLDRDVSGVLVVAKTDEAYAALVDAMKRREISRHYLALVHGQPATDRGKIDAPVGRHPRHRTRMAVVADGRAAVTWFDVMERHTGTALLDVRLETGRTHQIRTHLASIGHPIVGDSVYGRDPALARRLGLRRPFLHAYRLAFDHPITGEGIDIRSDPGDDLGTVLDEVRR